MESRASDLKLSSPPYLGGRALLVALAPGLALALGTAQVHGALPALPVTLQQGVEVFEASIPDLQQAMADGRVTAVQLVDAYLARIGAYDQGGPALNSMIRLNPNARAEAAALDQERALRGARGPLHGIPVIMKDNYDVADLPTSGGSIALAGMIPPDDAFQVGKLREAGAVIIGKSNMHELAYGITTISSVGGQTRNPYDQAAPAGAPVRPLRPASRPLAGAAIPVDRFVFQLHTTTCSGCDRPRASRASTGSSPCRTHKM